MKHLSAVLILLLLSCSSSSMKKKGAGSVPSAGDDVFADVTPGQYVVYNNQRGGQNALYCFMKYNKTEYVARRYDLNTRDEIVFQFDAIKTKKGNYDIKVVKIFSGDQAGILMMLTDMLNMLSQYGLYLRSGKDNVTYSDEWKKAGYTLHHTFKAWIPLFHLYKTEMANEPENSMTLLLVGLLKNQADYASFNLKRIPQAVRNKPFTISKTGDDRPFRFGIYETSIDGNWEKSEVSNRYMQSYWIKKISRRDAALTMEVIPRSMFSGDLEKMSYKALCLSTWIVASSVKVEKGKNYVKFSYIVLDPETMYVTYMYDIHMKNRAGEFNSFHFSSYLEVYSANKEYFDSIIDQLKITEKS